jgi:kynurenine formamidase
MCSPDVAKAVKDRARREGIDLSRRNFLRLGGLTAAGVAVASALPAPRPAVAQAMMGEVVDLSHVFATSVPTYVPNTSPTRETQVTVKKDGFYIQGWTFGEHTGTHMDIPAHFIDGGETVDNYAVANYISTAVIIDISAKAKDDANAMLNVADIEAWEKANGEIPVGALVCMYSGWEEKWSDVAAFRGDSGDGKLNFPGFGGDAAKFLVEKRNIHGIAVDTLSLDPGNSSTFDTHLTILGAGKYGVENVANLKALMGKKATVMIGIPRWEAGSGGPCRVLAMA